MVNWPSEVLTVLPRFTVLIIRFDVVSKVFSLLKARSLKFRLAGAALLNICILLFCSSASSQASPLYTQKNTLLVFGDSISAAYGMEQEQGWVQLLANQLDATAAGYKVVNASVSGETTGGGLIRLPKTLALHQPDVIIIELGGNDGLRGYPIDNIKANIEQMISLAQAANAKVLLIGMVLPPNYGRRYTGAFEALYQAAATRFNIALVPFLLNGVATADSLMQRDGIHPKPEAQQMMLNDILPHLTPLLENLTQAPPATAKRVD